MNLSLTGWRGPQGGSSRGSWIVCELPGACLMHTGKGWQIYVVAPGAPILSVMGPVDAWGDSWDPDPLLQMVEQIPALRNGYKTRRELLEALQLALSGSQTNNSLSQALTETQP